MNNLEESDVQPQHTVTLKTGLGPDELRNSRFILSEHSDSTTPSVRSSSTIGTYPSTSTLANDDSPIMRRQGSLRYRRSGLGIERLGRGQRPLQPTDDMAFDLSSRSSFNDSYRPLRSVSLTDRTSDVAASQCVPRDVREALSGQADIARQSDIPESRSLVFGLPFVDDDSFVSVSHMPKRTHASCNLTHDLSLAEIFEGKCKEQGTDVDWEAFGCVSQESHQSKESSGETNDATTVLEIGEFFSQLPMINDSFLLD